MNRFVIFVFDTPDDIWLLQVAFWLFQVIFWLSQVPSSSIQVAEILFVFIIFGWLSFRVIFVGINCKFLKVKIIWH